MGSDGTGFYVDPGLDLAVAVAASSAYPPVLAPVSLDLSQEKKFYAGWTPEKLSPEQLSAIMHWTASAGRASNFDDTVKNERANGSEIPFHEYAEQQMQLKEKSVQKSEGANQTVYLEDGGVLSNTGVELCEKSQRFLVSSAAIDPATLAKPPSNWFSTLSTTFDLVYERAEASAREKIGDGREFWEEPKNCSEEPSCGGLVELTNRYWEGAIPQDFSHELPNVSIPTRLRKLDRKEQEHLVNWGYLAANTMLTYKFGVPGSQNLPFPKSDYRIPHK